MAKFSLPACDGVTQVNAAELQRNVYLPPPVVCWSTRDLDANFQTPQRKALNNLGTVTEPANYKENGRTLSRMDTHSEMRRGKLTN